MDQDRELNKQDTEALIYMLFIDLQSNKNSITSLQKSNNLKKKQIKKFQRVYNGVVNKYKVSLKGKVGLDVVFTGIMGFITDNGPISDVKSLIHNRMNVLKSEIISNNETIKMLERSGINLRKRISKNIARYREMYPKEVK